MPNAVLLSALRGSADYSRGHEATRAQVQAAARIARDRFVAAVTAMAHFGGKEMHDVSGAVAGQCCGNAT
jgi:hypothetical protein